MLPHCCYSQAAVACQEAFHRQCRHSIRPPAVADRCTQKRNSPATRTTAMYLPSLNLSSATYRCNHRSRHLPKQDHKRLLRVRLHTSQAARWRGVAEHGRPPRAAGSPPPKPPPACRLAAAAPTGFPPAMNPDHPPKRSSTRRGYIFVSGQWIKDQNSVVNQSGRVECKCCPELF